MNKSKNAQNKAAYAGTALRRLVRLKRRKHDVESDLINALAITRYPNRDQLESLIARFDADHAAAIEHLDDLRKSSPLDWQSLQYPIDASISTLKSLVAELESHVGAIRKGSGTKI